jgi:hypothetical protein
MMSLGRNRQPSDGLIQQPACGGDMSTDKSILEKIAARIKEIIRIAEEAASHAMKAEVPVRAKKRVHDLMDS